MFARKNSTAFLVIVGTALTSSSAFAAGFEKSLMWSAESAGQAGAVISTTEGAESLYFNPAGLANSTAAGEVSLNFSPTFSKFSGANPFQNNTTDSTPGAVDGKQGFSPIMGALVSFKPTSQLGIGAGYYVSGGTKSKYEGLNYTNVSAANDYQLSPTVETDLAITEVALGAGYEVMPGLRFGAALRMIMVDADFSTAGVVAAAGNNPATAISNVTISDIKATRYNAYKLGFQYDNPEHTWGVGANYRSGVKFIANGTTSGNFEQATGAPTAMTGGTADLENTFPQQFVIGGYSKVTPMLRISPEYSYTNYSKNKVLAIRGTVNGTALSNITQNWKNQHIGRLGFEYGGANAMPIRFGYAYTSQVTPSDRVRSTFASPGSGHAIAAGTGMMLGGNIDVDVAGEYSFAKGKGTNSPEVASEYEFKSRAFAAHLSAKYKF